MRDFEEANIMLKVDQKTLDELERQHEGIVGMIMHFEKAILPKCPHCGSSDTADVECGFVGRTLNIAAATTKISLFPSSPPPGNYFCNDCRKYFD